jgi:hypothetical protein
VTAGQPSRWILGFLFEHQHRFVAHSTNFSELLPFAISRFVHRNRSCRTRRYSGELFFLWLYNKRAFPAFVLASSHSPGNLSMMRCCRRSEISNPAFALLCRAMAASAISTKYDVVARHLRFICYWQIAIGGICLKAKVFLHSAISIPNFQELIKYITTSNSLSTPHVRCFLALSPKNPNSILLHRRSTVPAAPLF